MKVGQGDGFLRERECEEAALSGLVYKLDKWTITLYLVSSMNLEERMDSHCKPQLELYNNPTKLEL